MDEAKGVSEVTVVQVMDNHANVTFDPQVLRDAIPLHGMPCLATLKLLVPE